jgi:lipid-binding SYLF domain-containing protein
MGLKACVVVVCLISLGMAASPAAADQTSRLRESAQVVQALRSAPDNAIPEDFWNRAQCVVVIPSMKKAAFVFGGEYGKGVLSCRNENGWTAPLFMQLAKGSWGLQIGGESVDLVMLVMNREGIEKLIDDKVSLGADASVAAGPVGRTGAAGTDVKLSAQILSYSRAKGVFAGIDLSGGVLRPDKDANNEVYGRNKAPREIVFGTTVPIPAVARDFVSTLRRDVRATTGQR